MQVHGRPLMRAILCGFAGTAPRSVTPNLIELLPTLLTRHPADSRSWISDIMFAVSIFFYQMIFSTFGCGTLADISNRGTCRMILFRRRLDQKLRRSSSRLYRGGCCICKNSHLVQSHSLTHSFYCRGHNSARSMKRMRDAAQQFALVARGLEGSSFGYASVSV